MSKLTTKEYWENSYKKTYQFTRLKDILGNYLPESYYYHELKKIVSKFVPKESRNIIEIGCSLPNHLITLSKAFNLHPHGIDYQKNGIVLARNYLKKHGLATKDIQLADFFDKQFQKRNKEKYDVVSPFCFIEHFKDPRSVIEKHLNLTKKNGLVIISVPSMSRINQRLSDKKALKKHHLKTCSMKLRKIIPSDLKIKYLDYTGGTINFGLYSSSNKTVHSMIVLLQIIQRLTINQLFKLALYLKMNPNNRYTSPSILLIGVKK